MKKRPKGTARQLWVAVKVERGFVGEARVFESIAAARRIAKTWRAKCNPDYDEIAVVRGRFIALAAR